MIKNRDNIFLVVREDLNWPHKSSHVCGAYCNLETAENTAAAYNQRWEDRGWDQLAHFEVKITTYYSE